MVPSMAGLISFYWMVVKRAFSGVFWRAEKWAGGLGLIGAIMAYLLNLHGGDEEMVTVDVPIWFFFVFLLGAIAIGLIFSPYLFWKEEKEKADLLAKRQEPKLRVRLASEDFSPVGFGVTNQTLGASRITTERDRQYMAMLLCSNDGLQTVEACRCSLIGIWSDIDGKKTRLPMYETIDLSWNRDVNVPEFLASIEPNETRAVYVASVFSQGYAWLHRKMKDLPLEYQRLLGGPGRYQLLIQFKSKDPDPLQVLVDLEIRKVEPEPNKLPKSEGYIAILEQGSPPLSRANIEA